MDRIKQINDKMAGVFEKYSLRKKTIELENRSMTQDEIKELNGYLDQIEELKKEREHEERAACVASWANKAQTDPLKPGMEPPDPNKDQGWRSLGEFLQAVHRGTIDPHNIDKRLVQGRGENRAILGASESVPADGGYLVQKDFSQEIFKIMHDSSVILGRCRSIPISGNANGTRINAVDETSRATGSRWGGVRGYWVTEGGDITSSKPKFRQMEINLHKLAALFYATDEQLSDAVQLESIAREAVPEELNFLIQDALINGTGQGMPLGILASPALVTVAKTAAQTATTLTATNVINMFARFWSQGRKSGVWLINQDTLPQLWGMNLSISTAGGALVWMPAGGISGVPYDTLGGMPVLPIEQCATLGTVGDIILADFSQYVVGEKGGLRSDVSMHVAFVTDQMCFRWIIRIDGQPIWNSPLTPYKGTNTISPFVALASRA